MPDRHTGTAVAKFHDERDILRAPLHAPEIADSTRERALDLLYALRLENGQRWGAVAADFQTADAFAMLDFDSPVRYHFLTRPRGGSKTTDLAALAVVLLLVQLRPGTRVYAIASDLEQGQLLLDSMKGFAQRTAALRGAFRFTADRAVATATGSTLQVLPCDDAGLWGLRPGFFICDEVGQWPNSERAQQRFDAVVTALPKLGGRLAVITTPSSPGHWSHALLEHARADPLWGVHETVGPIPWIDPTLLASEKRRLSDSQFTRLHLGKWVEPEDRLALLTDIRACINPTLNGSPQARKEYVIGIDLSVVHDRTAAVVAHGDHAQVGGHNDLPRIIVDQLQVWTPTPTSPVPFEQVEEWIVATARHYRGASVIIDSWNAAAMTQRLRKQGIRVHEFMPNQASIGRLAVNLHVLLRSRCLALPDDPELVDELANVRLRETTVPGVYRLDHTPGRHDDRAFALGLAALHISQHPPGHGPRIRVLSTRR